MYLHQLRLQAIGPFAGEHVVDFASLAASGIFLLEGPTGAGKSTLIDAVVFALYGKVASASSSEDRLRSAYAPDDVDSFVDLTFETGAGVYRVVRTPERMRRKKRGDGTTKQQAGIRLWRLPAEAVGSGSLGEPGDVGELVSARLDEAGLELQRIIGLDRTQFVQTIVLPQGEFANFLKANPEDRRGLLQKVFGTEIYERAQAQLATLRIDAQRDIDAARARASGAVERFVEVARIEADEAAELRDARTEHAYKLAVEHVAGMAAAAEALRAADTLAARDLADARAGLDEARSLADTLTRRTRLRAEELALVGQETVVEEHARALDAARRAAVVQPLVAGEERASIEAREAMTAFRTAQRAADVDAADPDAADDLGDDASDDALRRRRDEAAARSAALARLVGIEAGLPARRAAIVSASTALVQLREEEARQREELALRPAGRAEVEARRDALRARAGELGARTDAVARAEALVRTLDQVVALRTELADARATLGTTAATAAEACEVESALRLRRIAGMAGEIAATLEADDPCPVCGGREHPAPAPLSADHVSQEDVDAAEEARRGAESLLADADRLVAQLEERLAGALEVAREADHQTAAAELEAARLAVGDAREAQSALPAAERALAEHDTVTARLTEEHGDLLTAITASAARIEHDTAVLDADEAEVAEAVADLDRDLDADVASVAAVVADLDRQVVVVDALRAARAQALAARRVRAQRSAEREDVMATQGFDTLDDVRAALLPAREERALEAAVTEFRSARDRVRSGLAEPDVAGLPEVVEVDVAAARAVVDEAEALGRRAASDATLAESRTASAADAAEAVSVAAQALEEVEVAAEPVVRMANLATGSTSDNAKRLTLATFVLMRRFEDVVAAANERITVMSDGRYELERSDEKETGKGHKVGLALRVLDHQTGAPRLASSLSGGETFYVSLCLALGMADVVMAEAGGVDLGTLFVDEGFGSLDPETLDSVLHVLGGLRAGGRVVGVVSHVETLKQTISDGISVRRLPDGSSTLTVRAG